MRIITKNIRWLALIEVYNTAKFDHSAKNRSRDIVLTERCTEKKKKKKNNNSKNRRSAFPCRSNDWDGYR